jgi:3-oxoacyl-[acyl-carrier protein] reductase
MPQVTAAPGIAPLLADRILVITGASSGIGRATALAAAREGADLTVTYRGNRSGADEVAAEVARLGRRCLVTHADISRADSIEQLSRITIDQYGRIDGWINNAGADILTGHGATLSRLDKLDLLLAVDVRGTMLASWHAAELMKGQPRGGAIVNTSWDGAFRGFGGENPELYSAAKGAVLSFSRSIARSVAPKVRVNIVAPGWIETAFGEGAPPGFKDKVTRGIPLGRWGKAEDVAGAVIFLASDASRYMTGQVVAVNGGDFM